MASFRHYDFRTFFLSDVFSLFLLFFIFPPFFSFSPFSGTAQAQVKAETYNLILQHTCGKELPNMWYNIIKEER